MASQARRRHEEKVAVDCKSNQKSLFNEINNKKNENGIGPLTNTEGEIALENQHVENLLNVIFPRYSILCFTASTPNMSNSKSDNENLFHTLPTFEVTTD